jgi:3-oxo-5-alpha-steroid 4-dehydrogenase 3
MVFFFASGAQHDCHCYLASLKKYSIPVHPLFSKVVCPHYFAECLIYITLSVLAAPKGNIVNMSIFIGLVFVVVNLGVSAKTNREWYIQKFGRNAITQQWNMVPGVF